ncbi:hypothetical protein SAMN05880574_1541, partial [Chryseobacterium sp. RU37D]
VTNGVISFWTGVANSNTNERMRIHSNGNVGIGTAAPTAKLHVEGSQYLNAAITSATTKNALDINIGQDGFSYGNRTDNYGIIMRTNSSLLGGPIARINFGDINTTTMLGPRYLSFSVGQTLNELLYLTNNNGGNIGIGTTNPNAGASLDLGATNKAFMTNRVVGPSAISSPSDGMIIFDTTGKCFKGYGNGAWNDLSNCVNAPLSFDATYFPLAVMSSATNKVSATGFIRLKGGTGTISPPLNTVNSTGVTGLVLIPMNNTYDPKGGTLYFNISGFPAPHTPGASANFTFSINGSPITWTVSVD